EDQAKLAGEVAHLRVGSGSQYAFIWDLPKDDARCVDRLSAGCPGLIIAGARMIEYVQRVQAELQEFRFTEFELLAQVRIESVLTGRIQPERHIAAMAGERILENDRAACAVAILRCDRLQCAETAVQKIETHLVDVVGDTARGTLLVCNSK